MDNGNSEKRDPRSGRIVVVSHCILNVHSLEDGLSLYPGCEEDAVKVLLNQGAGLFQMPCPEMWISSIFRNPLPKEAYDTPSVRRKYRQLAKEVARPLAEFQKKGYAIAAVLGADGSPTCGIHCVGRWKDPVRKGRFPEDVNFVPGMGVFMEEFKRIVESIGLKPAWIGMPGKSLRAVWPPLFLERLRLLESL